MYRFIVRHSCTYYFNRFFFFFNDTATTEIYTLSLHDALPIYSDYANFAVSTANSDSSSAKLDLHTKLTGRSEEHTSELQSRQYLVCRLLLEKKKTLPSIT